MSEAHLPLQVAFRPGAVLLVTIAQTAAKPDHAPALVVAGLPHDAHRAVANFLGAPGALDRADAPYHTDRHARANLDTLARAIWGDHDYPRYLIHRLIQRLRDRLGDSGDLIENVRGAGYRLRGPMDVR